MSYKAITIYTPEGSEPHISAADDAFIHDSLAGGKSGILGNLECLRVDDNTVRLGGGGVSNMGYIMRIPTGSSHDLTIETGTQSLMRYDLVVAEFRKGGGDIPDTHILRVVKGTAASSPADPELIQSELLSQGDINQVALFRVAVNGLIIESVQRTAPLIAGNGYICCKGVDTTVTPSSGEIKKVSITAVGKISSGSGFEVENGAIVCTADGVVEAAGCVYMQGTPNAEHYFACYLKKNGEELTPGSRPAILYGAVSAPSQMVRVKAGDVLTLNCRTMAQNGSCLGGHSSTWLSARYI